MKKIIEYEAICSPYKDELVCQCANMITRGWVPYGGISAHPYGDYIQAMVKYEEGE